MILESIVVEFQLDDNVVYVTRREYLNKYHQRAIQYIFSYGTLSGVGKTRINTYYKSIAGVMKQFNKAVDALKNGTNIK